MNKHRGKLVAGAIVLFLLALGVAAQELYFGLIQKNIFSYQAKRYLAQAYSEDMAIKKAVYLWDNIDPISARAYPEDAPHLEFSVYPDKAAPSGFRDNYAQALWLFQAQEDAVHLLENVDGDLSKQLEIDFTCCGEIGGQVLASNGQVIPYSSANVTFDLTFQLNRPLQDGDRQQMLDIVAALQGGKLDLGYLHFIFMVEPPGENKPPQYRIPGTSRIATEEELDAYRL